MPKRDLTAADLSGESHAGHPLQPARSLPSGIPPDADPGPVPGEPEPKEPRNILLTLPPESAMLVRRISGLSKIPQGHLIKEIEGSEQLSKAVLEVIRARWLDWKARTEKADPFAGLSKE